MTDAENTDEKLMLENNKIDVESAQRLSITFNSFVHTLKAQIINRVQNVNSVIMAQGGYTVIYVICIPKRKNLG